MGVLFLRWSLRHVVVVAEPSRATVSTCSTQIMTCSAAYRNVAQPCGSRGRCSEIIQGRMDRAAGGCLADVIRRIYGVEALTCVCAVPTLTVKVVSPGVVVNTSNIMWVMLSIIPVLQVIPCNHFRSQIDMTLYQFMVCAM